MFTYSAKTSWIGVWQSTLPHTPKIQTRPPSHNPYLQPCGPHPCSDYTPLLIRVCTIVLVHSVGTSWTQGEHQFGVAFVLSTGWYSFLGGGTLHLIIPSLSKVRGTVCTHVHFRVAHRKLTIFTNVRVQTDHIHISDFFRILDYVILLVASVLPPYKALRILIGDFFT